MCHDFPVPYGEEKEGFDANESNAEIARLREEVDRLNDVVQDQQLAVADDDRTIREGECPICCMDFGPREQIKKGVRMMCGVEEHFVCDDCFQRHVEDMSNAMRIVDNRGTIPGCMHPECLDREGGCPPFPPRIIAMHVSENVHDIFMQGVETHLRRLIQDQNAREEYRDREEVNHVQRVLRRIGRVLEDFPPYAKCGGCGNLGEVAVDDSDPVAQCNNCRQPFCAICGFCDGNDAHWHAGQAHGYLWHYRDFALHGNDRVLRLKAELKQPQIIALLQNEPSWVQILEELPNIPEMEPWRNYIDTGAIRRAFDPNAPRPAVVPQLLGNQPPDHLHQLPGNQPLFAYRVGERVQALRPPFNIWYPATIARAYGNAFPMYTIDWRDDGNQNPQYEGNVREERIRRLQYCFFG
jgi:hypothetical protein